MTDAGLQAALDDAWHRESAAASLERWQHVCETEGWGTVPRDTAMLVRVFGASWYFTRFIFLRGRDAATLIDAARGDAAIAEAALEDPDAAVEGGGLEERVDRLRVLKNEAMLRLLVGWLGGGLSQSRTEAALTTLAESVLERMLDLFVFGDGGEGLHASVLGMGRLAGGEMNFGSDLDLIFLHDTPGGAQGSEMSRRVRALLRHIAAVSPSGSLYEVDMRLRPHGTGGALITTADSFKAYHAGTRDVWERQMMTRCRPVCDPERVGARAMQSVLPHVYGRRPEEELRNEIRSMRRRVEHELGRPQGKIEVKRGRGGLMDIDFISHYLQLRHGTERPELRTCSTRVALGLAAEAGVLPRETAQRLLDAYDWLKRVEACLRLFDMRSVSAFSDQPEKIVPLARGMGCGDDAGRFLEEYRRTTGSVRTCFDQLLGE
jgi:glutamate-ammonia-ligase adenylyltransferase